MVKVGEGTEVAQPVVHVEVRGLDAPELQEFYREVFGWERNNDLSLGDYSVAEIGDGPLTVGIGPVPEWSARSAKFHIQVDDIEETLRRIEAAGGKIFKIDGSEFHLNEYLDDDRLPGKLMDEVRAQLAALEKATGKTFGKGPDPLLVSVRSGSALSMPGMMDTILNLGLNPETLQCLIEQTGDERFAYDAYRRFIQLFGKVALGIDDEHFDEHFEAVKKRVGVKADIGLDAENLKEISTLFLGVVREQAGREFPDDVIEQLQLAIEAVFRSWMGKRAVDYRREFNITPDMANGTAVNVCTMVFGNKGDDCATGVGFTRNPGTGENEMFGEYLTNAQGEDVVDDQAHRLHVGVAQQRVDRQKTHPLF